MPTAAEVAAARAQVDNTRAQLQLAQNNYDAATLIAPTDGIVAAISSSPGQFVSGGGAGQSSAGTSSAGSGNSTNGVSGFITLTEVDSPQITAQVSEADIGKVQPGQKVNFSVTAYPGKTFTGTVAAIVPAGTTTSNVVTYTVLISVDQTDVQLLPSMTGTVTIVTQEASNTVLVPNGAISNGNVSVLRNGAVSSVAVQTGISDGVNTQIVSGLQAGDQVVTGVSSATSGKSSSSSSGTRSILNTGAPAGRPGG